jgi:hypothetical protein
MGKSKVISEPVSGYCAESEINMMSWHNDWIAISLGQSVQAIRL